MAKMVAVTDFLTRAQIAKARKIIAHNNPPHAELLKQIVLPNMAQIDRKLGQENDPDYIAYAIEYAVSAIVPNSLGGTYAN
jgi:hypothetical protein